MRHIQWIPKEIMPNITHKKRINRSPKGRLCRCNCSKNSYESNCREMDKAGNEENWVENSCD